MRGSESRYYEDLCFPIPANQQAKFLALADKFLSLPDQVPLWNSEKMPVRAKLLRFVHPGTKRGSKLRAA